LLPAGVHLWRLSTAGDGSLGLCCNQDGLFLGRTPLIERHAGSYVLRPPSDLEQLLKHSTASIDLDRLRRGLGVVKSSLDEDNLCLAQIAAVQLRIPDLPGFRARAALEAEDRLIKAETGGDALARADWDPAEHPRAGTPPNPAGSPRPRGKARKARRPRAVRRSCRSPSAAPRAPTTPPARCGWTGTSSAIYFMI
jgi:hypothetical protein